MIGKLYFLYNDKPLNEKKKKHDKKQNEVYDHLQR